MKLWYLRRANRTEAFFLTRHKTGETFEVKRHEGHDHITLPKNSRTKASILRCAGWEVFGETDEDFVWRRPVPGLRT